ncbi:DNA-directed RNA polymerase subunit beta [Medicago truncatula]|uniref:DNA-directed RNA polymerase subunit beta n=1 Tax=Medicago truncatula TaxID=3880 RepID=G7KRC8_MEDTR|nr:DNA-directed RNA polymerase subunit beta [Medicago truncatula]
MLTMKVEYTTLRGSADNENENEWEDRKVGRRKNFLVRRMELVKHFIRTNIEPEWMVLSLLPVLPPELRPIIQIDGGKLMNVFINIFIFP